MLMLREPSFDEVHRKPTKTTNPTSSNSGPQHPPTHGASRSIPTIHGETTQRIRSESGLSHRGPEKLTDRNHLSSPTNHPDRLDHAPTTIQESSHAGASERSTQPHARPFRPSPRLLHAEIPRIPNHRSASTTHATDTGPSTRLP